MFTIFYRRLTTRNAAEMRQKNIYTTYTYIYIFILYIIRKRTVPYCMTQFHVFTARAIQIIIVRIRSRPKYALAYELHTAAMGKQEGESTHG